MESESSEWLYMAFDLVQDHPARLELHNQKKAKKLEAPLLK